MAKHDRIRFAVCSLSDHPGEHTRSPEQWRSCVQWLC